MVVTGGFPMKRLQCLLNLQNEVNQNAPLKVKVRVTPSDVGHPSHWRGGKVRHIYTYTVTTFLYGRQVINLREVGVTDVTVFRQRFFGGC